MSPPTSPNSAAGSDASAPARSPLPNGVGVALVTFFARNGRPDAAATAARAGACVARGITSVLVAGTTGEAHRLSADDRVALATAVREATGDVPIVVGTGSASAAGAFETTGKVAAAGVADAFLAYAPEGSDPFAFFGELHGHAGSVPVLAYHNPGLPSAALDPRAIGEYGVAGVKDSSGSSDRLAALVELGIPVYVGSATQVALAGGCGAAGALLAAANVAPDLCVAAWHGEMAAQRALFSVHMRIAADFPGYLKGSAPGGA